MAVMNTETKNNPNAYSPIEALKTALDRHPPHHALACSFQVEEIMILDALMPIRIEEKRLPAQRLSEKGFTQIGCEPCASSAKPSAAQRTCRRRRGEAEHQECGLHFGGSRL